MLDDQIIARESDKKKSGPGLIPRLLFLNFINLSYYERQSSIGCAFLVSPMNFLDMLLIIPL